MKKGAIKYKKGDLSVPYGYCFKCTKGMLPALRVRWGCCA